MKSLQPDKRLFPPSEVYAVLRKISDTDLYLLGLSDEYARPEWMILTVMPVPPPPVRPSIAVDGGTMRSEDDLTYKLGDIIKASANVRRCEQEGAPAHVIIEFEQLLQVSVFFSVSHVRVFKFAVVPRRYIYGQRHRRHTTGFAKVRSPRESHSRSPEREGR
jgi:RNA polymerase Rpb1, domain 1